MTREHSQSPAKPERLDAIGIVSQGRLGFTVTNHLIYMHSAKLGIPIVQTWSPIWSRSVHSSIENALRHNPKYLLFFDGDGAWDMNDLRELYRIIEHETVDGEPIDAVCPVQADRTSNRPLTHNFRPRSSDPAADAHYQAIYPDRDYSTPITPVVHGHFGLTFVRAEALRAVGMPWLLDVPGADGSYQADSPGQIDPDTYFWVKFHEYGRTVVQANRVVVGHIELMVRWQQGPRVLCQSIRDFTTAGKPANLRAPLVEELTEEAMAAAPVDAASGGEVAVHG